ncbi:MAG: diguanylate cyclase [Pseudomonadota bacterium]
MTFSWPRSADYLLALAYFAAASLMVATTRFEGGVAFVWIATAILVPSLIQRPRREWLNPLALCGVASMLATGLFGLGWTLAVPLALANVAEAGIGAMLLGSAGNSNSPFESLRSLIRFLFAVGIVAPLGAALLAGASVASFGHPFIPTAAQFFVGHALGAISFIPIFSLFVSGELAAAVRQFDRRRSVEMLVILMLVAATVFGAFWIEGLPLLFLPAGPIIVAIFRSRQIGAAASIILFAAIGGVLTMTGHGPLMMTDLSPGGRMQFFQFCLAAYVLTVLPISADLKHRSRLHRELRLSEARYRMMADHSSDILMHLDVSGEIRFVSPSVKNIGGFDPEDLIGHKTSELIHPDDFERVRAEHKLTIQEPGEARSFDYRGMTKDGEIRWFETHTRAIVDRNGQVEGVLSVIRDITARKEVENQLTEAATTDPLTGLGNRRAFIAAAEQMTSDKRNRQVTVAIIDIDHFKSINDQYGHDAGDEVLNSFARLVGGMLRDKDVLTRVGGEEFAILFPNLDPIGALKVCDRVRTEIAATPCQTSAGAVMITLSGGVARVTKRGLDDAIKRADIALYEAKNGGRNRFNLAD